MPSTLRIVTYTPVLSSLKNKVETTYINLKIQLKSYHLFLTSKETYLMLKNYPVKWRKTV